jgi:pimeloyl-ACP methyl ester carboxylesterase
MTIRDHRIAVADSALADLRSRLERTRWPQALDAGWDYGMDPAVLREWCRRWARFDWRRQEARLNGFAQHIFPVDGVELHFLHVRSRRRDARPLLMMGGWPSSFVEHARVIEPLVAPPASEPAFHVVLPSLPGYGFSSAPATPGWNPTRMARAVAALLDELRYDRVFAHASDLGAGVMLSLARLHPERLLGMHSLNVYWGYPPPDDATAEEKEWLAKGQAWSMREGAYAMLNASKPQTIAPALNDSPAGLAAYVLEKWQAWSHGGLEAYDPDDLLAMLTVLWASGNIGPSCRLYFEAMRDPEFRALGRIAAVPSGVLVLPGDILPAPRRWGERWLDVVHWTEARTGGHFAALEVPDVFVADLRDTVRAIDARARP